MGVGYSCQEMAVGAVSVAAPIIVDGRLRAAIGVVCRSTTPIDRFVPAVRAAALGITRAIA
jgi:hypothetical protein